MWDFVTYAEQETYKVLAISAYSETYKDYVITCSSSNSSNPRWV